MLLSLPLLQYYQDILTETMSEGETGREGDGERGRRRERETEREGDGKRGRLRPEDNKL